MKNRIRVITTVYNAEKYIKKGMPLIIDGKIIYGSYDNKEGVKVYTTEIVASSIYFVAKKETSEPEKSSENLEGKYQKAGKEIEEAPELDPMSDLPF